jgi:GDPmannose 4,6-dehydratase
VELDPERMRPIDADLQVPDTRKFSKHTGWIPEISYDQTITDLLNYWRQQISKSGKSFLTR